MLKQVTSLILAIGICSASIAQINYGIKIGITESSISESHSMPNTNFSLMQGFQVGATLDVKLKNNLSLRTALQLTQKGFKAVTGNPNDPTYLKRELTTTYVELPIEIAYNIHLTKSTKLFLGAGPVLSAGVYGQGENTFNTIYEAQPWEATYKPFFTNPGCKTIDLGADFLMGMQFDRMTVGVNYNLGLINILNFNDANNITQKNRSFCISIGYLVKK